MESVAENTERQEAPRSPGAILAAERERQGLARSDIAQRLHMSVSQIEALEGADYGRLPRGTFLRGFTRNYARALGLDAEALVGLLVEDAPRETAPRIVVPSQNIRFDPLGARLANPYVKAAGIAAAVIVFGFAAMYWWLFIRPQGQAPVAKPAVQAPKVVAPSAESPGAGGVPNEYTQVPAAAPESAPATSAAAPAAGPPTGAPVAAPASSPGSAPQGPTAASEPVFADPPRAPGTGEGLIRLAFRGPAWVEIVDAKGKVLVSRTHAGGSTTEVVGRPPFNLVIGNAAEVRLTYNGRAVDLEPHTRVAVARLTLQ
jgi:cytoskeleton protein RodZ